MVNNYLDYLLCL
ncbi:hypothetical protein CGLO_18430 [Colletotrichum gloeosporioides Cg-14]|uniref:Uncharacterized protein n=1 Tax=Colletotrichum gloeosporioides (strain Cg-14) TaxID=1237896 RepID=T0KUU3_COLGC|nr:hypothetical protein CGLO_18430 [Colletotrichum gloeosporioides Cg-14]